jgi:WD40 repeat protein
MKILITTFLLITTISFSQNSDSYLATGIQDGLYEHFDSLMVKQLKTKSDCDCSLETKSSIIFVLSKEYDKIISSSALDTIMLDEYVTYDLPDEYVNDEIKLLKKQGIKFKEVNIHVDIERVWIRFSPIRFKNRIKYRITVTYNFNI